MLFLVLIYRYFFPLLSYINKGLSYIAHKKAPFIGSALYSTGFMLFRVQLFPQKTIGIPGFNMILECLDCFRANIPFAKKTTAAAFSVTAVQCYLIWASSMYTRTRQ